MNGLTDPIATTAYGKVRGRHENGALSFMGVRYGADTGGLHRFMAPRAPAGWTGVTDAFTSGPAAPQCPVPQNTDPFYSWYSAIDSVSEDCLFLNVFTPSLTPGKRPVLLWIHGGGWREFSGSAPGFNGSRLAATEDVVVVCINHRLTAFGFMPSDGKDESFADSANAGLLDVVHALKWVRENIAAFGGDPANVTIFGESGGASKIAAILSMKSAKGFFHKAIVQSSAGGMQIATREDMARAFHELASALDRPSLTLRELQGVPMQTVLAALMKVRSTFRGSIDDREFFRDPYFGAAPDESVDVPVMAGCTDQETTYHLRHQPQNFSLPLEEIRRRLARFLETDAADAERIIESYRSHAPALDATGLFVAITTDFIFKRNTYNIASLQAGKARAPVYAYVFERRSPIEGGRMGSTHTSELPFIFGTVEASSACVGGADELDAAPLQKVMMATWAAFARTGDPNNPTVPKWDRLSETAPNMMILNAQSRAAVNPGGEMRATLDHLPYFGYNHALKELVHG